MTIITLLLYIALVSVVLTGIVVALRRHQNLFMSFVQNFVGALFIVSGAVKAVDPLGTAYKMEQYFAEFYDAFHHSAMSFIAPVFPWLSDMSVGFSVFMIVLEIVLGIMIIIGAQRKFSFWLFLWVIVFFAVLTGFTYLTGYVPSGANFFDFGAWGAYDASNMRVTDCGCFGDFIKLEPRTSFFKDIFLMAPALLLVLYTPRTHQLFNSRIRLVITLLSIIGLTLYCWSNYKWDLPHLDFRPFKEGAHVAKQKQLEQEALSNAPVSYVLTHKDNGEVVTLSMEEYMQRFKEFPKEEWEYDQEQGEPTVKQTKISDFSIESHTEEVTDHILSNPDYHLMIVSHKLPYKGMRKVKRTVEEPIEVIDTMVTFDPVTKDATLSVVNSTRTESRTYSTEVPIWDEDYLRIQWQQNLTPFLQAAKDAGVEIYAVTNPITEDAIHDFQEQTGADIPFYHADDILLKTIIRSNPGIVLWKDGRIVKKWHIRNLPTFQEMQRQYMD